MHRRWLQLPIIVALALASWISAMDQTGDPAATWVLSLATILAAAVFAIRLLLPGRSPRA